MVIGMSGPILNVHLSTRRIAKEPAIVARGDAVNARLRQAACYMVVVDMDAEDVGATGLFRRCKPCRRAVAVTRDEAERR